MRHWGFDRRDTRGSRDTTWPGGRSGTGPAGSTRSDERRVAAAQTSSSYGWTTTQPPGWAKSRWNVSPDDFQMNDFRLVSRCEPGETLLLSP